MHMLVRLMVSSSLEQTGDFLLLPIGTCKQTRD